MKRILLIILFLFSAGLYVSAQEKLSFPVKGIYRLGEDSEKINRDFNSVEIQDHVFHLKWSGYITRSFEIIGKKDNEYTVQRFFLDDNPREEGKEQFNIRIDKMNEKECYLTIIVAGRNEKIHLIKTT